MEPISCIFAKEKMELEASQPDGLCVGPPVFKGSAKVIKILSGEGDSNHFDPRFRTFFIPNRTTKQAEKPPIT